MRQNANSMKMKNMIEGVKDAEVKALKEVNVLKGNKICLLGRFFWKNVRHPLLENDKNNHLPNFFGNLLTK